MAVSRTISEGALNGWRALDLSSAGAYPERCSPLVWLSPGRPGLFSSLAPPMPGVTSLITVATLEGTTGVHVDGVASQDERGDRI